MARKHHTKHNRSKSRYPERLAKRGLSRAPEMESLDDLRKKHAREGREVEQ